MTHEVEKLAKTADDPAKNALEPRDHLDASVEMRRTMMKRLAASGFLAPAVLVTMLKKPAAAS